MVYIKFRERILQIPLILRAKREIKIDRIIHSSLKKINYLK